MVISSIEFTNQIELERIHFDVLGSKPNSADIPLYTGKLGNLGELAKAIQSSSLENLSFLASQFAIRPVVFLQNAPTATSRGGKMNVLIILSEREGLGSTSCLSMTDK
jgi:hypothetical protein